MIGRFRRSLNTVLEQGPAQSFQIGIGFLFPSAPLVDGDRGVCRHMKLVERHSGIRQMFSHAFDESRRHVDADGVDLFRSGAVLCQILSKLGNGLAVASWVTNTTRRAVMSATRVR